VPSVVVRDELRQGRVHEVCVVPELVEAFYAVTAERRFPHPLVCALVEREEADLLGDDLARLGGVKPARL
jgi:LysR family transcriptional activator of nhaA